jgi:hypothetical protein
MYLPARCGRMQRIGTIFAACFALIQLVRSLHLRFRRQQPAAPQPILWWVLPAVLPFSVLLIIRFNRFENPEWAEFSAQARHGDAVQSLAAGVVEFAVEIAGRDMVLGAFHSIRPFSMDVLAGSRLPMELLLMTGVALCWARFGSISRQTASRLLQFVAALGMASILMIAAAELHFGAICCDRHEVLRECWIAMSAAGLGIASSAWISEQKMRLLVRYSEFGTVLLCAAVLSLGRVFPSLIQTYVRYAEHVHAGEQNFQSGFRSGTNEMVFTEFSSAGILPEEQYPTGIYSTAQIRAGSPQSQYPYYILRFFGKDRLLIRLAPTIAKPEMQYPGAETFESTRPQGAATLIDTRQDTPSLVLP